MKTLLTEALAQLWTKKYFGPEISKGNTTKVQRMGTHLGRSFMGWEMPTARKSRSDVQLHQVMRIPSSTIFYKFIPHQEISASTWGPPIVFDCPREPRGAQHHGRGEQQQSQEPLHTLSPTAGTPPGSRDHSGLALSQSHPLELPAQPMQQGLCRNKCVRRDKNPPGFQEKATLLTPRVLLKGPQRISQLT